MTETDFEKFRKRYQLSFVAVISIATVVAVCEVSINSGIVIGAIVGLTAPIGLFVLNKIISRDNPLFD